MYLIGNQHNQRKIDNKLVSTWSGLNIATAENNSPTTNMKLVIA